MLGLSRMLIGGLESRGESQSLCLYSDRHSRLSSHKSFDFHFPIFSFCFVFLVYCFPERVFNSFTFPPFVYSIL
jgi:hypothetical protein